MDCGAGGSSPPLAMFFEHGYRTHGVDISERQLEKARQFCVAYGMDLDITKHDMRDLPFKNEAISFIYSYSSICHMTKKDVAVAMQEIIRVLKKEGLCFISFCSVADRNFSVDGPKTPGEYPYKEDGETWVHSIFGDNEPEFFFRSLTYLQKEKRQIKPFSEQGHRGWAELLYFAKKL